MHVKGWFQGKAKVNGTNELNKGELFSFVVKDLTLPNGEKSEMALVRHPGPAGSGTR